MHPKVEAWTFTRGAGNEASMLGQLILGKYRVMRPLDEGGMSKLYLARQIDPARDVVVKVLKDQLRAQSKTVEHFRREIYITARFNHPNAVACYDFAATGTGAPLLVLEYLRGVDLNTLLQREGRLTPERTGRLLVQLCDALQAAHEQGIVHRDLKPGNLMILYPGTPQETVKLMDFGLAKMSSMLYISPEDLIDFRMPAASGTPEYISPEMVRGMEMDGRGDLYSVGVMLFEMLTGRRPFLHSSIEQLMLAHADAKPPSFADAGLPNVIPPALEAVVMSCLAKYPDGRPASAWELAQSYEKALGRRIIQPRASAQVAPRAPQPAKPTASVPIVPASERNAFRQSIEATMPEAMAMIKLRGFIYDLGGEVVESVPGMIKVRLAAAEEKKSGGGGLFGWMGGGGTKQVSVTAAPPTDLELHMERRDPAQASRLTITLVMKPGPGLITPEWRNRCSQIGRDLQAYLMGR
jgi:eukaryotic-like serine/threonine-protein kinase